MKKYYAMQAYRFFSKMKRSPQDLFKNIKSFSVVLVKSVGADAVTAEKLAVDGGVIELDVFTNCFLR